MSLLREVGGNFGAFGNLSVQSVSGSVYIPVPRYAAGSPVSILDSDYVVLLTSTAAQIFVDLPPPETCPGRTLILRAVHPSGSIVSTVQNVVPPNTLPGEATAQNIVVNGSDSWGQIVSNGTYWLPFAGNNLYLD